MKLTRTAILSAAEAVADSEGLDAVTVRRLARDLGTGPASLYRHVADRGDIVTMLADHLASGFTLVDPGRSPRATLIRQWVGMHEYLHGRPWGVGLIADGVHLPESARAVADHNLALLRSAGVPTRDCARAYRALWLLTLGQLMNRHPFGHHEQTPQWQRREYAWALRALLAGILP